MPKQNYTAEYFENIDRTMSHPTQQETLLLTKILDKHFPDEMDSSMYHPNIDGAVTDVLKWHNKELSQAVQKERELREEADAYLMDAWNQFAYPGKKGCLWSGGLSTLESIESYLYEHKYIDAEGKFITPQPKGTS